MSKSHNDNCHKQPPVIFFSFQKNISFYMMYVTFVLVNCPCIKLNIICMYIIHLTVMRRMPGLKRAGVQRTRQRSWPFYSGKEPKRKALEVVFDFIDMTAKNHYEREYMVWTKPTRAQLEAALDDLMPRP